MLCRVQVRTFRPVEMEEVGVFVGRMEAKLNTLYDECAVLRMFGDWPESRYDACKLAAAQYK